MPRRKRRRWQALYPRRRARRNEQRDREQAGSGGVSRLHRLAAYSPFWVKRWDGWTIKPSLTAGAVLD